jgi:hypothetical protein
VCCAAAVPVPVIVCTDGEFEALLVNDKFAEVAPLVPGVKVTVKAADWPALSVAGSEIPERENSLLVKLAELIVTVAPLAVRLPFSAELEPTVTLPKLRLVGDTANVPEDVPVPESTTMRGELEAFDTTDRFPVTAPAAAGVKVTVNVTL